MFFFFLFCVLPLPTKGTQRLRQNLSARERELERVKNIIKEILLALMLLSHQYYNHKYIYTHTHIHIHAVTFLRRIVCLFWVQQQPSQLVSQPATEAIFRQAGNQHTFYKVYLFDSISETFAKRIPSFADKKVVTQDMSFKNFGAFRLNI